MMTQKAMKVLEGIIIYLILCIFSLFHYSLEMTLHTDEFTKLDSTIYIIKLSFLLINIYQDWLKKSS